LSLLAVTALRRHPSLLRASWVGAAAAIAASAKLVGLAVLPLVGVASARIGPSRGRGARIGMLLAAWVTVVAVVDHAWLGSPAALREESGDEILSAVGVRGYGREDAWRTHLAHLGRDVPLALWAAAGAHLWLLGSALRRGVSDAWLPVGVAGIWLVMLSLSSKVGVRYVLPVQVLAAFAAALGVAALAGLPRRRGLRIAGLAVAIALVAGSQAQRVAHYDDGFSTDPRAELLGWAAGHLPAEAVIGVVDSALLARVQAAEGTPGPPPRLVPLGDPWSLAGLRSRGVTHVALGAVEFRRYLADDVRVGPDVEAIYRNRRAFLTQLEQEGSLVFERKGWLVVHPTFRLHAIGPEGAASGGP
ncbi:MAG: hypothetical protein HKP30_11545, partial [Myxococcales bacterium]|nr:hypothetical protein [Myxococcales bacterium]